MNCQEARELSSDYLDQRLAPTRASLLEEHLRACSGCKQEMESLRTTVSLIGSLDEIKTSPEFVDRVQRKIEKRKGVWRVWGWLFEPIRIKVPLEITALILLSIGAFHIYYRSPELSMEAGVPVPLESFKAARDKSQEKSLEQKPRSEESYQMGESAPVAAAKPEVEPSMPKSLQVLREGREKLAGVAGSSREASVPSSLEGVKVAREKAEEKTLDKEGKSQKSYQIAKKEAVTRPKVEAKPSVQPFLSQPAEPLREARDEAIASVHRSEIHEVMVDKVDAYEAKVKALLEEIGGRVLTQEGSSASEVLLTVELPQSRQTEFLAALKEEVSTRSKLSALRQRAVGGVGALGKAEEEFQQRDALTAGEKAPERMLAAPATGSSLRRDEPTVTLQLRILPKK